jgi:hypothetical protein
VRLAAFLAVSFADFLGDFFGAAFFDLLPTFFAWAALATFLAAFLTDVGRRFATALVAVLAVALRHVPKNSFRGPYSYDRSKTRSDVRDRRAPHKMECSCGQEDQEN